MQISQAKHILIIQTAFIGDLLLAIPLVREIRQLSPDAKVSFITRKGVGQIMQNLGLSDQLFEVKKGDAKSYSEVVKKLQGDLVDLIICPHTSFRSSWLARSIPAKRKIFFKSWFNILFGFECVHRNLDLPDAMRQLSLLNRDSEKVRVEIKLFLEKNGQDFDLSYLCLPGEKGWVSENTSMGCRSLLDQRILERNRLLEREGLVDLKDKSLVALFPGSVWNTKRWTEEGYIQLGKYLKSEGKSLIVLGSPDEKALCDRIANACEGVSLAGRLKLFETLILLPLVECVISNDSGSMHLAAVAEVPTVAIFGPTVLSLGYRPWQNNALVVQNIELKCRPCGKHGHKSCPIKTHDCMKKLTSDEVKKSIVLLSSSTRL